MARTGRRPGTSSSREEILAAARSRFAADGYDGATIRGIAASAGVDPGLVRHYFGSKEHLFVESMEFPVDPAVMVRQLLGPAGVAIGALVVVFLGLVSSGGPLGTAFLPDAYRAIAPWLPVGPAAEALRGALFFGGAGLAAPLLVVACWAILGVAVLAARDLVAPATPRAELATA